MKSERQRAKERANEAFSKYIRIRDAIDTTGDELFFVCITCGREVPVRNNDCGHFVPGRSDSVLYDEHNAHGQCSSCNRFKGGLWVEYERAMIKKYGREETERLKDLKFVVKKMTASEFREVAEDYKIKLNGLIKDLYE